MTLCMQLISRCRSQMIPTYKHLDHFTEIRKTCLKPNNNIPVVSTAEMQVVSLILSTSITILLYSLA